ncbi:MAG: AsmA-like C-terminal region-containing protein [Verrucomicrobiota bacterium]
MKNIGRFLLTVMAAMLAVAVIIFLAVNLYVQSQGTQRRIQHELSQRLGATLHLRRISVTPWAGLKVSGITIPQTQPGLAGNFLDAKTFRLRIRFTSLFSQRLVIKEISLIKPDVVWVQNAEGKWRLPSVAETMLQTAPATAAVAASVAPSPATVPAPPVPEPARSQAEAAPAAFTPEIGRVNLTGGRFRFLDGKSKSVATFEDVRFRSSFRNANELRGKISIKKTSLRDRFFLEELQSPLRYDPDEMDLSRITARAGGGEIGGRFTLLPEADDSPFTVSVTFREVQADRIVSDAGGPAGTITGRLEGHLEASGKTADANALSGAGEIILRDGQVQQYSLLVMLGQLLQIEDLRQLHLDQAEVKYHINPGVVTIDELILRSKNIRLSASGTVSFEGQLRLESQLAVDEKIRSQLFRAIRDNFQPIEEAGYAGVNFQVSGTLDRPKTNLMEKLVGRDLKDLGSLLSSFMGGGKREKAKKKSAAGESTPVPEVSATPTASP